MRTDFEIRLAELAPMAPTSGLKARIRGHLESTESRFSILLRGLRWALPTAAVVALASATILSSFQENTAAGPTFSYGETPLASASELLFREGEPPIRVSRVTSLSCALWQYPREGRRIVQIQPTTAVTLSALEIQ